MERDAFASLFSKQRTPAFESKQGHLRGSPLASKSAAIAAGRRPTAPQGGSRFVECPVCGNSVHSSLAQSHVERCCISSGAVEGTGTQPKDTPQEQSTRQERPPASPCGTLQEVNKIICSCTSGEGSRDCAGLPSQSSVCTVGAVDPAKRLHGCAKSHDVESRHAPGKGQHRASGAQAAGRRQGSEPIERPGKVSDGAAEVSDDASNAFSRLMTASALSNFREEMYLWSHRDGTLSWGWGPAGCARPPPPSVEGNSGASSSEKKKKKKQKQRRWCCQVATKGPEGRKAGVCELWTNLPSAAKVEGGVGDQWGGGAVPVAIGPGGGDNAGVKAARPGRSLSRLSVPILKSMLQKNVRRGRPEAAVRCALELSLKSWGDAIRRVLVIVVEDSLLHPAAPFLSWLMAATSKGYRPPACLVDAFLCVVYETAACPVRDSAASCQVFEGGTGRPVNFDEDDFAAPHPRDLVRPPRGQEKTHERDAPRKLAAGRHGNCASKRQEAVAAAGFECRQENAGNETIADLVNGSTGAAGLDGVRGSEATAGKKNTATLEDASGGVDGSDAAMACCRRALLMRMSYGGMAWDQSLLKGACLAWGERCGHYHYTPKQHPASSRNSHKTLSSPGSVDLGRAGSNFNTPPPPPDPPSWSPSRPVGDGAVIAPFGYMHDDAVAALEGHGWTRFLVSSHTGTGMPLALRLRLLAHIVGGEQAAGLVHGAAPSPSRDTDGNEAWQRESAQNCFAKGYQGVGGGSKQQELTDPARLVPAGESATAAASGEVDSSGTAPLEKRRKLDGNLGPIVREADAILSGVDFHCSKVVDDLLRSTAVAARVGKAIAKGNGNATNKAVANTVDGVGNGQERPGFGGQQGVRGAAEEDPVIGVRHAAKQAMWACSGGLNSRKIRIMFNAVAAAAGTEREGDHGIATARVPTRPPGSPSMSKEIWVAGEVNLLSGEDQISGMDSRVWHAMSADVMGWTRRFVRERLAPGALNRCIG